jgi:hypothetical protein
MRVFDFLRLVRNADCVDRVPNQSRGLLHTQLIMMMVVNPVRGPQREKKRPTEPDTRLLAATLFPRVHLRLPLCRVSLYPLPLTTKLHRLPKPIVCVRATTDPTFLAYQIGR